MWADDDECWNKAQTPAVIAPNLRSPSLLQRQTPLWEEAACVCPYVMSQCALPVPHSYVLSELIAPMLSLLRRMRETFTHSSDLQQNFSIDS